MKLMEVPASECDYVVTLQEHAGGAGPIAPAKRERIPTSMAADRLAEERLAMKEKIRLI